MNIQDRLSSMMKPESQSEIIEVEYQELAKKVNSSGIEGSVNKSLNFSNCSGVRSGNFVSMS